MTPETIAVYLTHPDVSCWTFGDPHAARLNAHFPGTRVLVCNSEAEFLEGLGAADVALVWRFRQEWFSRAPRLRVLATPAAGRDYFHVSPPPRVTMLYGRFHGELMAETVAAMLLGMVRGVLPAASVFAGHAWPRRELAPWMVPLRSSHVVIVGFGRIGTWIGRLLKPFGVRLTGIRRHVPRDVPEYFSPGDRIAPVSDLDRVLPSADHLILVLPGGPDTEALMDARRIRSLPRGATLCNVGRGTVLDEEALCEALRDGHLSGAALDVFREEPLPADSPLRSVPRLWRLPHASAISPNYLDLFIDDFAAQAAEAGCPATGPAGTVEPTTRDGEKS